MTSERELWACAHEMTRLHGVNAYAHAIARLVELGDAGDHEGVVVWRLVIHRLAQLRSRAAGPVH